MTGVSAVLKCDGAQVPRATVTKIVTSSKIGAAELSTPTIYADLIFAFLELRGCLINTIFLIYPDLFSELRGLNCEPSDPDNPLPL
jgi:hypothetical protein